MSAEQVAMARKQLYHLLTVVRWAKSEWRSRLLFSCAFSCHRKEAVPLVDAFDICDEVLNSALGRYDGDVYTHLYQWALKAPRNKEEVWMYR